MFTHLVLVNRDPYFYYADNEKEALKMCEKFKDDIVGVVSGKNIIVKHPRLQMTLEQSETLQIEGPKTLNEIINPEVEVPKDTMTEIGEIEATEELEKELMDELEKLQGDT